MDRFRSVVGGRIRHLRTLQGLTQEKVSEQCDVNASYIGQIERGEKNPSLNTLSQIAEALGCSLESLLADPADPREKAIRDLLDELSDCPIEGIQALIYHARAVKAYHPPVRVDRPRTD